MARLEALEKDVILLRGENIELRERLAEYENPKNSRNSSVPPSKDENRPKKNQSLRPGSDRKVGGQSGHKGSTLEMTSEPDAVVDHCPDLCDRCGNGLSGIAGELVARRQVVDIPPVVPHYTEHRVLRRACTCGNLCEGSFPEDVRAPISYGPNVQATVAYLHTRQYLPVGRTVEFFRDFCGLPMSQGTICNLLKSFTAKSAPAYALIAQKVRGAKAVGTDETGIKVDGNKGWYWAWQYGSATYIVFSENRGIATIDQNFPSGLPNAVLVHDCWASHFRTACRTHQLCTAHLLRELVYFTERYASQWAMDFRELIYRGLKLKKKIDPDGYGNPIPERDGITEKMAALLDRPLPEEHKDLRAFHKRMIKYRDYILTFLHHHEVPPDNNASERAIRNVKVKQKVSGQFKTPEGAQAYAVIRSVTDTCVKNGQNVLGAFKTIANLLPE
jgi:transposase